MPYTSADSRQPSFTQGTSFSPANTAANAFSSFSGNPTLGGAAKAALPLAPFLVSKFAPAAASGALGGALGWLGGPWGAAAMTGAQLLAGQVGQGRRAADRGVQAYENPFGDELASVVRKRDAGDMDGAKAQLEQAWNRYRQGVSQGFAQGGKDALVAQQSLNNPILRQTADSIAKSLGFGNFSWERNQQSDPFAPTTPAAPTTGAGAGGNTMATLGNLVNLLTQTRNQPTYDVSGARSIGVPTSGLPFPAPSMPPDLKEIERIIQGILKPDPGAPPPPQQEESWLKKLGGLISQNVDEPWARGLGIGADITGRALQARALGDYNERLRERTAMMDRLGSEERARRDYYAQTLMPNLLRGTGHTPQQLAERMRQFPVSQMGRST